MQILWLSHVVPYPPKAGFLLRSYNLLAQLAKYHTVDLFSFVQEPWMRTLYGDVNRGLEDARGALSPLVRECEFMPIDNLKRRGGRARTALAALLSGESYTGTWLRSARAAQAIRSLAAKHRYDLIHFDTVSLLPYLEAVGNTPATLGHHNIESHLFTRRSETESSRFLSRYFRREGRLLEELERRTARRFRRHITCSELDSTRLREIVGDVPVECIPNGVDCGYFKSASAVRRPSSLLFVGTMNWHPNSDAMMFLLEEAWSSVVARVPEATLDIVGANAPAELTALAQRSRGVTYHGFVPDVRPYFDAAQLFVCPIRDGGGTKLKLLDAFAMGKAVIAHPIALEGIEAEAGKHVEVAESAQDFSDAIVRLLGDPARCARLGEEARRFVVDKYSYEGIGRKLAAVMEHAASGAEAARCEA